MSKVFTFHYPDGIVRKHKVSCGLVPPSESLLDGIMWNSGKFYILAECNNDDIWLDEISKECYYSLMQTNKFIGLQCGLPANGAFMSSLKEFD